MLLYILDGSHFFWFPSKSTIKSFDVVNCLKEYKTEIDIVDPFIDKKEAENLYNVKVKERIPDNKKYSAIIVCVAHTIFKKIEIQEWKDLILENGFIFDIKGIVPREIESIRL